MLLPPVDRSILLLKSQFFLLDNWKSHENEHCEKSPCEKSRKVQRTSILGSGESRESGLHRSYGLNDHHLPHVNQFEKLRKHMGAVLSFAKLESFEYISNETFSCGELLVDKVSQL